MVAQINSRYFRTSLTSSLARLFAYACIEGRPLTTKGRWINPFVFAQFSLIKRLPQLKQVRQPVYILGTGRSGSTFLGNILSLHPDICYLNEPKALWHSVFPHEDVIGSYSNSDASFRLDASDATDDVIKRSRRLYAYALALTASRRILDKHGELIFRVPFIKAIYPDAKFIFLVRDGRDTVASVARWSETKGVQSSSGMNDWWGIDNRKWKLMLEELVVADDELSPHIEMIRRIDDQLEMAAIEWILTMKEGQQMLNTHPESTMLINYEDILAAPERALEMIFDFADLDHSQRVIRYAVDNIQKPVQRDDFTLSPKIDVVFQNTLRSMGY